MQPQSNRPYKRRQLIVDRPFQQRFIWRFLLIVVGSILLSNLVTLGFFKLRDLSDSASQNLSYFTDTIHTTLAFSRVFQVLWLPLLISGLLGCILVAVLGIFFSHRIAGPLFNLKRVMRQVEEGNLNVMMKIRNKDEFHDVEEAFNRMVGGLKFLLQDLENAVQNLPEDKKHEFEKILKEMQLR
jgi:nitrogen fixation/metabolism regulation signal transduction histidine kinase